MKKIIKNKYFLYSAFALAGLFIGWILFHSPGRSSENKTQTTQTEKAEIWTCSMHPQIRMPEPGKCPICGMNLIPLYQSEVNVDPAEVHLTREAAELANVLTTVVGKHKPVKEVRLYGKVQADERRLQSQVAQIPGRIEKLMVNYTGESVRKGQTLAILWSPELVIAQQELIEAAKTKLEQPEIYEAARARLLQWKLTGEQISQIENSGQVQNNFEVVSTTSGVVTSKNVNNGDYVERGAIMFNVADLSVLWIMFDAYESDIQFIKVGDKISFTVQALPGNNFSGKISFIDPAIDPVTRVVKVRVEADNSSGKLKPEMFATGIVSAGLKDYGNAVIIPQTAVLWTGKRSIVYVKQPQYDEPVFRMREIGLGPMLGDSYIVTDGLSEGEEIVTQGAFSVDAAAQLEGKPSMMNPTVSLKK
jgi:Cu(I)/Ag(I) efflux system membrane fusion protein